MISDVMAPRDKLQELILKMFSGNKRVSFTDQTVSVISGEKEIGVASLSSGEKHVLRILVEALHADGGPILVDEPEISMHVDWQNAFVSALESVSPSSQLILATHSPEVMSGLADEKIFEL